MEEMQIAEAAEFLLHLRRQRKTVSALPFEITPRSLEDAYAVQDELHNQAGWQLDVLKVGCTSAPAQEFLGIPHEIGGRIPAEGRFESGAAVSREFFAGTPLIECEIAVRVDASGEPTHVAPAMELVNGRLAGGASVSGPSIVADNSAAAGVVLGEPLTMDEAGDLEDLPIELRAGDETAASGSSNALIAGVDGSRTWTLAHEASRGRSPAAGAWIITGTCTGLTTTDFDTTYTADFGFLGTVSFTLS